MQGFCVEEIDLRDSKIGDYKQNFRVLVIVGEFLVFLSFGFFLFLSWVGGCLFWFFFNIVYC